MCVRSFYRCFSISSSSRKYYFLFLFPCVAIPPVLLLWLLPMMSSQMPSANGAATPARHSARHAHGAALAQRLIPGRTILGPHMVQNSPIDGCSRSSSLGFDARIMSALSSSETFLVFSRGMYFSPLWFAVWDQITRQVWKTSNGGRGISCVLISSFGCCAILPNNHNGTLQVTPLTACTTDCQDHASAKKERR